MGSHGIFYSLRSNFAGVATLPLPPKRLARLPARGIQKNGSVVCSVMAGYSHGSPLELKLKLLTKWADHVEGLVQPQGAVLLR
jgi:hypothetical protein